MSNRNRRVWRLTGALIAAAFAFACLDRELVEVEPAVQSGVSIEIEQSTTDQIDLLVLVDNSNSMREEQANLAANMATIIETLTSPPDSDSDGIPDYPPVANLQIGVISTDMGTAGYPIPTCDAERGDDGVLQNLPSPEVDGCAESYPEFLSFDALKPDPDIAKSFECIASLGTGGCGFEQQLFAVEKALTVHAAPGAANAGFLRPDALLAILLVTDEEDCSVDDTSIFNLDDESLGPLNLRCFLNDDKVRPVQSFVDSILTVKPNRPDRIVVAAITGVPPDLVELSDDELASDDIQTTDDFEDILDDARMQEVIDNSPAGGGNQLVPSCDTPLGKAFPPRRIVEFIQEIDRLGNNGIVQSICQADWRPTMRAITRLIQSKVRGACLARPLVGAGGLPLETGQHADCVVRETLEEGQTECGAGRFHVGEEGGRTVCQVCQQGDGTDDYPVDQLGTDLAPCLDFPEDYWFYTTEDDQCRGAGKVEFQESATPGDGSTINLECLSSVAASD